MPTKSKEVVQEWVDQHYCGLKYVGFTMDCAGTIFGVRQPDVSLCMLIFNVDTLHSGWIGAV
jgi:hypothetical protein